MTIDLVGKPRVLAQGFQFTECPRWHDGMLYFSDMHAGAVYRLAEGGSPELVVKLDCNAGGLGFTPDSDLLVVAMNEGRVLRLKNGELREHATVSAKVRAGLNDMVVSPEGRCYVGRYFHPDPPYDETMFFIDEQGRVSESADTLFVANGMVLAADGKRLIVAESGGGRLAAFELTADGAPVNRSLFAQLPQGHFPDGICGDDEGGVWVACAQGPGVVRVVEGGAITHRVVIGGDRFAYACVLGGSEGDTLFICTAGAFDPVSHTALGGARIEAVRTPFRRAGLP